MGIAVSFNSTTQELTAVEDLGKNLDGSSAIRSWTVRADQIAKHDAMFGTLIAQQMMRVDRLAIANILGPIADADIIAAPAPVTIDSAITP